MNRLPEFWVAKIFQRLTGVYGAQFRAKFSHVENGVDVGIAMAMEAWATELAGFADRPEAIAYALDHLPQDHAPNAIEFYEACRRCPKKEPEKLEYKPSADDIARHKEMAHKAAESVKPREFDGLLWAKKPRSQKAMDVIADAKKHARRFPALASVFDFLVKNKIANEAGKLLHRWDGQSWVKCR